MINKKLNQNNSNEIYSVQSSYLDENFLNNDEDELIEGQTFFDCLTKYFCPCMRSIDMIHKRKIVINKFSSNPKNFTKFENTIKNQKYNLITFFPLALFNQFRYFNNQFYLLMAISQFIPELKVGFLFSYVAPLTFVLFVTLLREAIDDIKRYKRDKEQNSQVFIRIDMNGNKKIFSKDIQIGDLIEINKGQRIPADILIIKSYDKNIYIKTDQLDGETDWKLRKAIPYFQNLKLENEENLEEIFLTDCSFIIEPPSKKIYDFNGVLEINSTGQILNQQNIMKEPLSCDNTMWMNSILASKKIIGLVIYTGKETRAEMNSQLPKNKVGELDKEVNYFSKFLFGLMLILGLIILFIRGFSSQLKYNVIIYCRYVVLLCSIIPISLKINLDIAKSFYSYKITNDERIEGAIARNSMIPEELGRIDYIFSDKTGTLTKNEMLFKKLSTEIGTFSEENIEDLKLILKDECNIYKYPCGDLIHNKDPNIYNTNKRIRRNRTKIIRDAITALCLCNNVTPIYNMSTNEYDYQASSPDEIALVKFTSELNMQLKYRDDTDIILQDCNNYEEKFKILALFPFSSETKRMGIVLNNLETNQKIFYLKGAENVICKIVKEDYTGIIKENTESLSSIGLRTLVICQKLLSNEDYEKWNKIYQESITSLENRQKKIGNAMNLLENKMELLCITGVEDQLQEEVSDTIESLKNAGIKIWMLTGDKVETATCIAISSGLKGKNQRTYYIRNTLDDKVISSELEKIKFQTEFVLIIDGNCLDICLKYCKDIFFEISLKANSVVCCRCSPTQKAKIIKIVRNLTKNKKRLLAIGDGGNDVAMIQEAHVGVGIVGKEGKQASLSADYSINNFKDLKLLLLWFGRISYKNTATIAHFVIHRGLIISFLELIFIILFYCVPIALYNGNLMVGYSTIYTALPVISLIFDEDTTVGNVIKFPSIYKDLQKGRQLSIKSFLKWFWKSVFQSSIIMLSAIFYFDHSFMKISTVTFTCLILAELLNVYTEIKKFHYAMYVSLGLTLVSYLFSLWFLNSVLDLSYLDFINVIKIIVITLISWLPFYLITKIMRCIFPETHEKLNILKEEE